MCAIAILEAHMFFYRRFRHKQNFYYPCKSNTIVTNLYLSQRYSNLTQILTESYRKTALSTTSEVLANYKIFLSLLHNCEISSKTPKKICGLLQLAHQSTFSGFTRSIRTQRKNRNEGKSGEVYFRNL